MEKLESKVRVIKIIWEYLKEYRDDEDMTSEKLLEKIMAVPFPEKGEIR